ncbi:histidine phosphatase family protein [Demequina sp.]|uniref:SixA phosphatase family protein n=1 Tax=Demequina sp. TaxID=2050685 RepID=UPI0025CDD3B6|nr:histidine phosphatase family protein [Demequina sp.]
MPTLILARHAKAEAPAVGLDDMARSLALIGRKASTLLGRVIADAGLQPSLALVSPAVRTQQTWKLMSPALEPCTLVTVDELYETHVAGLEGVVRELADVDTVIMVGHEPTWSAAAAHLAGPGSERSALQRVALGLPTGTAAVLEFDCPWPEIGPRCGRLVSVLSGRDVGE